jgi:hypothetical protein
MEACPRRWMLNRAEYPELWDGVGFPSSPSAPALFGDVVHLSLEVVLRALAAAGCDSTRGVAAVGVVKALGGYTVVVERALELRLERLHGNPAVKPDRLARLRTFLTDRVPEARARVQAIMSRTTLPQELGPKAQASENADGEPKKRTPLGVGAHPEVRLVARDLRMNGRVDLLTVDAASARIVDYKTGEEDPGHQEQVKVYALLWDLDDEVNPAGLATSELTVAYSARDVTIPGPTAAELRVIEAATAVRIAAADADVSDVPRALPSPENCQYCPVRHLCEDYWSSAAPAPIAARIGEWLDIDGVVTAPNGAKSWHLRTTTGETDVLLRTPTESTELHVGDRVRVLGVRRDEEPDTGIIVAAMTAQSDLYRVT